MHNLQESGTKEEEIKSNKSPIWKRHIYLVRRGLKGSVGQAAGGTHGHVSCCHTHIKTRLGQDTLTHTHGTHAGQLIGTGAWH